MLLSELLTPERVRIPLQSRDKHAIVRELSQLLVETAGGQLDDVVSAVEEREALLSTGIGFGVAIPHGRAASVPDLAVVCGTTPEPVAYDAIDGQPVRLFFMLVGPERCAGQHVKALGRLARLVRSESLRARLLAASTAADFFGVIAEAEVA